MTEDNEARALVRRELTAHAVEPTEEIVAACIGAITVYHARAQLDRELLARFAAVVIRGRAVEIREALREVTDEVGAWEITRGIVAMGGGGLGTFAALVGTGMDPDEAARNAGGTGRPVSAEIDPASGVSK